MTTEARLDQLIRQAETVVECVTFDESGKLVAGKWVGGNGGLIGRETLVEVDKLREMLNQWKRWHP